MFDASFFIVIISKFPFNYTSYNLSRQHQIRCPTYTLENKNKILYIVYISVFQLDYACMIILS